MSEFTTQHAARQHYLTSIGIDVWLPTSQLEGAATSPVWVWGEPEIEQIVQNKHEGQNATSLRTDAAQPRTSCGSSRQHSSETARAALVDKKDIDKALIKKAPTETDLSDKTIGPVETTPQSTTAQPTTPQPSTPQQSAPEKSAPEKSADVSESSLQRKPVAPPRFRLALIAYSDALAMVQLPMDVLQPLAPEHQRLVYRILQSVTLGAGESKTQLFGWPMINNPAVDQRVELAQAAVQRIEKRMHSERLPLFIFGHQLVDYLGYPEQVSESCVCVDGRWVIASPTLNELISIPGFKRDLWVRLQTLQAAL